MKTQIKNLKTSVWFLTLMMTLSFFSCEKDPLEDCRKDPTCEYFTCKVNGERWEPQCEGEPFFGCTPWDVQYYRINGYIEAVIKNEKNKTGFKFELKNIKNENQDYFFEPDSRFYESNNNQNCVSYYLFNQGYNLFRFEKIDTINKFIKAKFSFKTLNDCGEEVHITDGEFNLPYRF